MFVGLFSFYQNVSVFIESPKHNMVNKIVNYAMKTTAKGKEGGRVPEITNNWKPIEKTPKPV